MKDGRVRSELWFGRGNRKLLDIQEAAEFSDSVPGEELPKFAHRGAGSPALPRQCSGPLASGDAISGDRHGSRLLADLAQTV
jgi:hypothetical protein